MTIEKKILVVDDEPEIITQIKEGLRENGCPYKVIGASDGLAGLELARREQPDLVILDLMLPKLDGHKVCGLLKRDRRYSQIRILIITARAEERCQELAQEMGADAYLTKPFDAQALLEKVRRLI